MAADLTSHHLTMGDRGRLVIPADARERHGWSTGTPLIWVDTPHGLLVMSADEAMTWLRTRIAGRDLLEELFAERRAEAASS